MRHQLHLAVAAFAGLFGCSSGGSGGSGESNQYCHTIAVVSSSCSGCAQVTNPGAAFDGRLGTAAAMGSAGQGSFLATSEAQPPGSIAGVYFILTDPAGVSVTITTFLDGIQQESRGPSTRQGVSDACSNMVCDFNDGAGSFVGMDTTEAYDAIQATISNSSNGTLQVNEICVR